MTDFPSKNFLFTKYLKSRGHLNEEGVKSRDLLHIQKLYEYEGRYIKDVRMEGGVWKMVTISHPWPKDNDRFSVGKLPFHKDLYF